MRRAMSVILVIVTLILAACRGKSDSPAPTGIDSDPAALSPVLIDLQRDYESLLESHQSISDIWEGLADEQTVQCGSYPTVIDPDSIHADGDDAYAPLADTLRRAAIDLDHATNLWKAECNQARPTTPPEVINEGRLAARAAGDALKEAESLLAEIQ